jgi:D-alanyl-D-alanine carboxypeptidase (penicillin-binding protein 5/6)
LIFRKILLLLLSASILAGSVYASENSQDSGSGSSEDFSTGGNRIAVHLDSGSSQPPPDITASAAIVINLQNGTVIYEKNASAIIYPASAVKIMTAILTVEYIEDSSNNVSLDTVVTISRHVIDNTLGNRLNPAMSEGENFTLEDMLNAVLINGANDACLAIAELISGSVPAFVSKMNERARELGCENTIYMNPHGIHAEGMITTALDTAKIALHASNIPMIMDISSAVTYEIPTTNRTANPRILTNRNHFISTADQSRYHYEHARGINSGSTEEAGHCLVTVGQQHQNLSYLCVIMGATATRSAALDINIINSFDDAKKLLDWAFAIYAHRLVVRQREPIETVNIELAANRDEITLVAEDEIRLLIPQTANIAEDVERLVTVFDDELFAPIYQGDILGELVILYKGEIMGRTNLLATEDVEPSNVLLVLDRIRNIVSRPWFTASVIIFIVMFAAYISLSLIRRSRRERKRFY